LTVVGQSLSVDKNQLDFGDVEESTPDSRPIHVINHSNETVEITNIQFFKVNGESAFNTNISEASVLPNSSINIWVRFIPGQNISYNTEMLIETASEGAISIDLIGNGRFSNTYYASTFNKREEELKIALSALLNDHSTLGYSEARNRLFMDIDNEATNGSGANQNTVTDVYTGLQLKGFIDRADAENKGFAAEHAFPQGIFNFGEPMQSDLHNMFISDKSIVEARNNTPFGVISEEPIWQQRGSLLDSNVFEPRDEQKGKAARAMMYFVLRYGDFDDYMQSQDALLREWNNKFLPEEKEYQRNNAIYLTQGSRNPFVDYPQFLDRISDLSGYSQETPVATVYEATGSIGFGTVNTRDTFVYSYVLVNTGNVPVMLSELAVTGPFQIDVPTEFRLQPGEDLTIPVKFWSGQSGQFNGKLSWKSDVPDKEQVVVPIVVDWVEVKPYVAVKGVTVYPNPSADRIYIDMVEIKEPARIELCNSNGYTVLTKVINGPEWVSLMGILPGIYYLHVQYRSEEFLTKVVKAE